jgi:nitroreductase
METWDAIRARRNVRVYTEQPVPADHLDRLLEAGWRAPSAANRQLRDFVLVTDREQLRRLSECWQGAGHIAKSAATIVLVTPVPDDDRTAQLIQFDLGQAAMEIMLAATDLGIGSGHSAVGDQDLARSIVGVPADHLCAFMIGLGYPGDRPLKPILHPNRRPFDEVVHRGRW